MIREPTPSADAAPDWYRDAVIYELHVRAFSDSNEDGIGDFRGLIDKLDYLHDLGVTAIWLLPFYPSPMRDDGYDIADYRTVNPSYGNMRDVAVLIRRAHERGLKVITELVLNHTSDQHPWFQRARRAPAGSRWRNFYVWNDTPELYPDARIIFSDFEASNWSWDPVAGQYYWHRFYSHQPDLNFDNAEVRRALVSQVDHWLRIGVDGLRLDAVPYLYERQGTSCENLPETHGFLRDLRRHVDERYPGRMLLAEANQWPEDAAEYFGDGDECHMAFHFPLMPRLFMAIQMEDRFPIIDILQQTPEIPEGCQWALFLRNHDELTLEMVTDEERDYMYRMYAHEREARINLGIRRRLAPLLGNDRSKIELMNGLLLSLPGTPVIYYGDEIGMGDNIYLGDRDGVRTPDAVERRPQRGLLAGQPAAPLPAADHRPRVPLRDRQRRDPGQQLGLTAVVDAPHAGAAQALRGVRARDAGVPPPRESARAGLPAPRRRAQRADRRQPVALPPVRGARPVAVPRLGAGGARGPDGLPADRRPALPAHPGPARGLLALAGGPAGGGGCHRLRRLGAHLRRRRRAGGDRHRAQPRRARAGPGAVPAHAPVVRQQGPEHPVGVGARHAAHRRPRAPRWRPGC